MTPKHIRGGSILTLIVLLVTAVAAAAGAAPTTAPLKPIVRQPKYPLKTARTLVTPEQIRQARYNVKTYAAARRLSDRVVKQADEWAAFDDEALRALLTSADVPRAFAVSAVGCPNCKGKIIQHGRGDYGWIVDHRQPFKVKCPVDGNVYPSNDYAAYYASGFTEKRGWDTSHVDDGWGWADPATGEKFWFVAYYNHHMWHKQLVPAIRALSDAYLLTHDRRYAHKAAVMLHRVAEVYPAMDHATQSRYGSLMRARGGRYPGKVINHIWETGLVESLAASYDAVWETIDSDRDLQRTTGKTGEQIRAFIEANLLEEGIDAVLDGRIRGNFGMHQSALVHLGLARQFGEQDKWFDDLLHNGGGEVALTGLEFALYNLIYRDGVPSETGPGYNFLWVQKLAEYGDLLHRTGRDVFALPKTRRLFDAVLEQVNIGRFTPSLGDSGSVRGGIIGQDARTYHIAYRHYRDPAYARWLTRFNQAGEAGFRDTQALFHPIVKPDRSNPPPPAPRLLDGYGLAILNNPADTVSTSLYYGLRAGHGHYDRLGFELFAHGKPIMPDPGYPDAMNDYVPGIYTWSKNTIAHNTVTVDAQRQPANAPGVVQQFATSPFARVVDVAAPETYPQCSQYRRAMVMVDVGEGQSYFIDLFTVAGGKQHDYSLHGPAGEFEMIGGSWSEPAPGTLAGEDVPLGQIYDDPKMGAKGYKGGYSRYGGSGFQHLFNVRRETSDGGSGKEWVAQWSDGKDESAKLRIRVLPQPQQQMILADARISPVKSPEILKYFIARRTGDSLSSQFVSVIEPFTTAPHIRSARRVDDGESVQVIVEREGQTDVVLYGPAGFEKAAEDYGVRTDAAVAIVTVDSAGRPLRAFAVGGSSLTCGDEKFTIPATLQLEVAGTDPASSIIRLTGAPAAITPDAFVGRVAHFTNDLRRTAHPIVAATREGNHIVLTTKDDLLVGRAIVNKAAPTAVTTATALPLAPIYRGAELADAAFARLGTVTDVGGGRITLTKPMASTATPKPKDKVWLVNVGAGDSCELPGVLEWERPK